jgi:uncharacterized 2Fe-2S/4Fe-4S cluster protein (DUF4445 family)
VVTNRRAFPCRRIREFFEYRKCRNHRLAASPGPQKAIFVGNASLTGAALALISNDFKTHIQQMLSRAGHFELNEDPDFITDFAMNMAFPDIPE